MRVTRCQIEGFGHFAGLDLRFGPGLTVVTGPNEAGKTTLLEFIAYVLFGFRRGRSQNRYEPLRGGRHGGKLFLATSDGEWVVERFAGTEALARRRDSTDRQIAETTHLLGGADQELFRTVFAFSLAELNSLKDLATDRIREKLFSAGIAGAGRSVQGAIASLDSRAKGLWRQRADCELGELGSRLDSLRRDLREARSQADRYPALQRDIESRESRLREIRDQLREASLKQERLNALIRSWPAWTRKAAAVGELQSLEDCPIVGRDTRESAIRINERLKEVCRALDEIQDEVNDKERALESLPTAQALVGSREAISQLVSEADRIDDLLERLQRANRKLEEQKQAVQLAARGLAVDPESDAVRCLDISDDTLESLRQSADALDRQAMEIAHDEHTLNKTVSDLKTELEEESRVVREILPDQRMLEKADAIRKAGLEVPKWESARQEAEESAKEASAAEAERDRRLSKLGLTPKLLPAIPTDWESRQHVLSLARAAIRSRDKADEEERRLADRERELRDLPPAAVSSQNQESLKKRSDALVTCRAAMQDLDRLARLPRPPKPLHRLPVLAAICVLAVSFAVSAALLWPRLGLWWGVGSIAIGLLAVGLLLFALLTGRDDKLDGQALVNSEEPIRRRLSAAARELGIDDPPTSEAIERASSQIQIDLRELEETEKAADDRRDAERRLSEQKAALDEAAFKADADLTDWRRAVESLGLPSLDMRPADAEPTLAALVDAQEHEDRRRGAEERGAAARKKAQAFEDVVLDLARATGTTPEGPPTLLMERITTSLEDAEAASNQRKLKVKAVSALEAKLKQHSERRGTLREAKEQLVAHSRALQSRVARHGLNVILEPGDALSTVTTLADLARAVAAQRTLQNEIDLDSQRVVRFSSSVAVLAEELSERVPSGAAESAVAVRAIAEKLTKATALLGELQHAREEDTRRKRIVSGTENDIAKTLEQAGAPDLPTLLRWAEISERRAELERRQKDEERNLAESAGSLAQDQAFHDELDTGRLDEWRVSLSELETTTGKWRDQETEVFEDKTRLQQELASIAADAAIPRLTQDIAVAEEHERELQGELLVLQIAQELLTESLDQFRRERQPAVLRHAGELFRSITGGQYVRVEGNPVESSLSVLDSSDNVKAAEFLSTGTAGQLYLCLRIGLARDYSSRTVPLPFVMDDVLVKWGIHLTQVTTTCSMVCHGRFPARSARVRSSLLDERSLPRLSVSAAMARRFQLPALRRTKSLAVA